MNHCWRFQVHSAGDSGNISENVGLGYLQHQENCKAKNNYFYLGKPLRMAINITILQTFLNIGFLLLTYISYILTGSFHIKFSCQYNLVIKIVSTKNIS